MFLKRQLNISTALRAGVFISSLTFQLSELLSVAEYVHPAGLSQGSSIVRPDSWLWMKSDGCKFMFLICSCVISVSPAPNGRSWISEKVSPRVWIEPLVRAKVKKFHMSYASNARAAKATQALQLLLWLSVVSLFLRFFCDSFAMVSFFCKCISLKTWMSVETVFVRVWLDTK